MDPDLLIDQAVAELKQTTVGYVNTHWQTPPPGSHWAKALALLEQAKTPAQGWVLLPPQPPVTKIVNAPGLGVNVNNQSGIGYHDYLIDGTGDSAILLQGTTTRCSFARMQLLNVARYSGVSWAKHAVYCKARGNTFQDILAQQGGYAASSLSVRMGNNTFRNTVLKGFNYVSYYEHDGEPGLVQFINGDWEFTADTAVWGDDSNEPPTPGIKQAFLFDTIAARGPGSFFLKFRNYQGAGVTIRSCTLNGKSVTAQMVEGVANLTIV